MAVAAAHHDARVTTIETRPATWRRWLGLGLILYGIAGVALAAGGAVLVSASFRGVDRIADAIVEQRNALTVFLSTTATVLENAATSTDSVDEVLGQAEDAVGNASTMVRSLATAAEDVAAAATFQIFGQQPLAGVASSFTRVAEDARGLADRLDGAQATLAGTTGDTGRLRSDLEGVAEQVRSFSEGLSSSAVLDDLEEGFNAPRIVLYGLLAWLGVQAIAAVVAGVVLIVGSRRRVVVVSEAANPFRPCRGARSSGRSPCRWPPPGRRTGWSCRCARSHGWPAPGAPAAAAGWARCGRAPGSGSSRPRTARSRCPEDRGTARPRRGPWPPARGRSRT